MLELKQIESFYPEPLRAFKRNLLREYVQYKILEAIFDSPFGNKLAFMGGTAIHLIHENPRFSEDLDFDNRGLMKNDFDNLSKIILRRLKLEGYSIESRNVYKGAYRSYVKISDIMYQSGISPLRDQKLLVELDVEPQEFSYSPDKAILNKFDVFLDINVVPVDILLAQKITAIFSRKRPIGRDFFDAVFLSGKTKPNFEYLNEKLGISDYKFLVKKLNTYCKSLDFRKLAKDAEPFLYRAQDSKKVLNFMQYLNQIKL